MPVFFVSSECVAPPTISITGDLLAHLRDSLRTQIGEIVLFGDGAGHRYCAEITELSKRSITGRILEVTTKPSADSPSLFLGQAALKGEKMDWVIQKATELGVVHITPLLTKHTIVQFRSERVEAQLARWRRIALEAAQQSEQWQVPTIGRPQTLETWLSNQAAGTVTFILAERHEGTSLRTADLPQHADRSVRIMIGPEGGWSKDEVLSAGQAECIPVTLGPQILRSETAAIAAISILQSRLGKLE